MITYFRITHVDMDGYLGRDHHPSKTDVGLVVRPVSMSCYTFVPRSHEPALQNGVVTPEALALLFPAKPDLSGETGVETVFTCVTEDGRVLELMDFEVEPLTRDYAAYLLDKTGLLDPRL